MDGSLMRELCVLVNVRQMVESEPLSEACALCLSCEVGWWRVGHTVAEHVGGVVLREKGNLEKTLRMVGGRDVVEKGKREKPSWRWMSMTLVEHTWRRRVLVVRQDVPCVFTRCFE